jgi:hypothetical protein
LDADVMLTKDGIVLVRSVSIIWWMIRCELARARAYTLFSFFLCTQDRFVVEMSGRLRLDTLTNLIGSFLREYYAAEVAETDSTSTPDTRKSASSPSTPIGTTGPLYYHEVQRERVPTRNLREEMETAVPLTDVLASSHSDLLGLQGQPVFPQCRRSSSVPKHSSWEIPMPDAHIPMRARRDSNSSPSSQPDVAPPVANTANTGSTRQKRQLVNRRGTFNLDDCVEGDRPALDYVTVPTLSAFSVENIDVPLIPFDEIMLIGESAFGKFILPVGRCIILTTASNCSFILH